MAKALSSVTVSAPSMTSAVQVGRRLAGADPLDPVRRVRARRPGLTHPARPEPAGIGEHDPHGRAARLSARPDPGDRAAGAGPGDEGPHPAAGLLQDLDRGVLLVSGCLPGCGTDRQEPAVSPATAGHRAEVVRARPGRVLLMITSTPSAASWQRLSADIFSGITQTTGSRAPRPPAPPDAGVCPRSPRRWSARPERAARLGVVGIARASRSLTLPPG